jgi:hypothetical protein
MTKQLSVQCGARHLSIDASVSLTIDESFNDDDDNEKRFLLHKPNSER